MGKPRLSLARAQRPDDFLTAGYFDCFIFIYFPTYSFSVFVTLSIKAVKGGIEVNFIGLKNFQKILFGSDKGEFIGVLAPLTPFGWLAFSRLLLLV